MHKAKKIRVALIAAGIFAAVGLFCVVRGLWEFYKAQQPATITIQALPESSSEQRVSVDFSDYRVLLQDLQFAADPNFAMSCNYKPVNAQESGVVNYPYYSGQEVFIGEFVLKMLDAVPLYPADAVEIPSNYADIPAKAGLLQVQVYSSTLFSNLTVWQETPDAPTVFVLSKGENAVPETYTADAPVMDTILDIARPYTLDAAQTTAKKFLNALALKHTETLAMLANPYDVLVSEWDFLNSPAKITELTRETVLENSTHAIYRISFEVEGEKCAPFTPGQNERILEIGYAYDSAEMCALSLVEEDKFNRPKNNAEKAAYIFASDVTSDPFEDPSKLLPDFPFFYILYRTPAPTEEYTFTQEEMDEAMQKYFGLPPADPQATHYYNASTGKYEALGIDWMPGNCRITDSQFKEDGSCIVTAEFYRDGLQTLVKKKMEYHLQKNSDGTYRFLRGIEIPQ